MQARFADLGRPVGGERGHGGRFGGVDDGVGDAAAKRGAAGDLDLVLDGGLDQDAQQVLIAEQGAGGDDRAGDLDLVEGQHIDQGQRCPVGAGQAFGQGFANVMLGLARQGHENLGQDRRDFGTGRRRVAKGGDPEQQPLAVVGGAAFRESQKFGRGNADLWSRAEGLQGGDGCHGRAPVRLVRVVHPLCGSGRENSVNEASTMPLCLTSGAREATVSDARQRRPRRFEHGRWSRAHVEVPGFR